MTTDELQPFYQDKVLKELYRDKILKNLQKTFQYKNIHQVPKLVKIQINRGLGIEGQNNSILQKSVNEIRIVSGQQPIITKAKKSIAGFKIREEMNLGVTVTLRKLKMYDFLEKLIHLVLPRVRDFRGLSTKGFDKFGNYNFGLQEQLVFPEINYDDVDKTRGFNISIVTTAKTKDEGISLLKEFGFPLVD
uniref:Large ribosomal subunit protein uL5c n=1 Tax=Schizocladia ischiensis TaxID=196139 RepID=A0A7S6ZPC4_9STRA|nr:ribosomal protein L5 [Schizocladia ischiensis]QOW07546.1 ribosomal protein L5 [Schizocladia ischiensis]